MLSTSRSARSSSTGSTRPRAPKPLRNERSWTLRNNTTTGAAMSLSSPHGKGEALAVLRDVAADERGACEADFQPPPRWPAVVKGLV